MQTRKLTSYIHDKTLQDLIVADWLMRNHILKNNEEVANLHLSPPDAEGVRTIEYEVVPDLQTITI